MIDLVGNMILIWLGGGLVVLPVLLMVAFYQWGRKKSEQKPK